MKRNKNKTVIEKENAVTTDTRPAPDPIKVITTADVHRLREKAKREG